MKPCVPVAFACLLLTGCAAKLEDFNRPPKLSPLAYNMVAPASHTTPGGMQYERKKQENYSLWEDRGGSLFRNPRAGNVGDILTVEIKISDKASLDNSTNRSRDSSASSGADSDVSFSGSKIPIPFTFTLDGEVGTRGKTSTKGTGTIDRSEEIDLSIAAVVIRVLPNHNLAIRGSQEVRVNHEVRVLTITGIVRPQDIDGRNMISYEKIAEARVSYGGRGRITEVQQPAWGQQLLDLINPF